jgi:hypothetical protein
MSARSEVGEFTTKQLITNMAEMVLLVLTLIVMIPSVAVVVLIVLKLVITQPWLAFLPVAAVPFMLVMLD